MKIFKNVFFFLIILISIRVGCHLIILKNLINHVDRNWKIKIFIIKTQFYYCFKLYMDIFKFINYTELSYFGQTVHLKHLR